VTAIPKPPGQRLAHTLKQDLNRGRIHGQQIINLQTAVASLQTGAAITAPSAAGSTYSESQVASLVTAVTDIITALQQAGIIAS
jgi:hypothetical protein